LLKFKTVSSTCDTDLLKCLPRYYVDMLEALFYASFLKALTKSEPDKNNLNWQ